MFTHVNHCKQDCDKWPVQLNMNNKLPVYLLYLMIYKAFLIAVIASSIVEEDRQN